MHNQACVIEIEYVYYIIFNKRLRQCPQCTQNSTLLFKFLPWRSQPYNLVMLCKFFCVYRPYKESISKEMNNDNDLNLHSMAKLSGWLRY